MPFLFFVPSIQPWLSRSLQKKMQYGDESVPQKQAVTENEMLLWWMTDGMQFWENRRDGWCTGLRKVADIVVVMTSRDNESKDPKVVEFVRIQERFGSMVTRCQEALFIVGNMDCLCAEPVATFIKEAAGNVEPVDGSFYASTIDKWKVGQKLRYDHQILVDADGGLFSPSVNSVEG
uniref:Uncharacterized protein n=1 Tax=Ditylenchus dipsaci TaxID=166011 RepID=A0A915EFC4_9BILA